MPKLTKRELIAAIAMHAIISKSPCGETDLDDMEPYGKAARGAVDYADSLIEDLAKTERAGPVNCREEVQ